MLEFSSDLNVILKTLNMSLYDLSDELGFEVPTISNWLNNKYEPDRRSKEDIYSFAYRNGVQINLAHEEPIRNLGRKQGFIPLYHGAKRGFIGEDIDLKYSDINNDFAEGFYCGDNYEQSISFVCNYNKGEIILFGIYKDGLKIKEFKIDNDWMLSIAYYRGLLDEYKSSQKLKNIINKSKNVDLIIAPIADNRMFDIISDFVNGEITDEACRFALGALDLGRQYVIKTKKAISKIGFIKNFYICTDEKEYYRKKNIERNENRIESIKHFKSRQKKGKYIEDLL